MRSENPTAGPRPRIVVADGHTTNPGDLDWARLAELGELTVHDRSGPRLAEHVKDADIVLTNKETFPRELLSRLPRLRFISVLATGTNVVDVEAARERGIVVSNVPGYGTDSVAQHTIALLLAMTNRVAEHWAAARDGRWSNGPDFSLRITEIRELAGKAMGIIGFGAIGQAVGKLADAFGMRVLTVARAKRPEVPYPVEHVELETLLRSSHVVSLHCPLTEATRDLMNPERLALMQKDAFLINTGRGGLVDEDALFEALSRGAIAGAALDVLKREPPAASHPLLQHRACITTPHLAWASNEARARLLEASVENVRAFLAGNPRNVV